MTLTSDATGLDEKASAYAELVGLSEPVRGGSWRRTNGAWPRPRAAKPTASHFRTGTPLTKSVPVGGHAMTGLVEGTLSFRGAALEVAQSVERGFIRMLQTTASRAAAGPLASLLGQSAPAAGEGVSDVLGNAVGSWLFGSPQQLGAAARAIPPRWPPTPRRSVH